MLGLAHTSRRLVANIDADLEHRDYSLETVENETVGGLTAVAEVELVQDRFSWAFNDDYGQGINDPFSGIGPDNRQKINVISSGPRVVFPVGNRTSLEFNGTYTERRFDESNDVDSDSVTTELGLHRQTSTTARVGIVASSDDTEYLDVIAPEYQIDRFGFRYEKQLATGRVFADFGKNKFSSAGFENDGPLYDFAWIRSLTARSELSIEAGREFTDAGDEIVRALGGEPSADVIVTPNPFERTRFGVAYVLTMSRTVVTADIDVGEEEYIGNSAYDNDATTLRLSFVRMISPRLGFGLGYETVDRDFSSEAATDGEDSWTSAWLNRALGRRFSLGIAISSYDRSGFNSYEEERYELRFGYSPTGSGTAAMESVGR